jgi:hypothetical protein
MEVPLKPVSRQCAHTSEALQPGAIVVSFLMRQGSGELQRFDVLESHSEECSFEGEEICRWRVVIRARDETDAEARKQSTQSTEELFLSLCEEHPDEASEQRTEADVLRLAMKQLLALQLERRRVLRCVDRRSGRFVHIKSKQEYSVPESDWDPKILLQLHEQLSGLVE